MPTSKRDDRRWTLRRPHPMTSTIDGPRLALGETVDVVPAAEVERLQPEVERLRELLGAIPAKAASAIGPGLLQDIGDALGETPDWRCECGDLNRAHEAFCYRCGAGQPESDLPEGSQ